MTTIHRKGPPPPDNLLQELRDEITALREEIAELRGKVGTEFSAITAMLTDIQKAIEQSDRND